MRYYYVLNWILTRTHNSYRPVVPPVSIHSISPSRLLQNSSTLFKVTIRIPPSSFPVATHLSGPNAEKTETLSFALSPGHVAKGDADTREEMHFLHQLPHLSPPSSVSPSTCSHQHLNLLQFVFLNFPVHF